MPSFATSAGCCAARFADVDSASGLFLIFAAELAADYSRHRPRATSHSAGLLARAASSADIGHPRDPSPGNTRRWLNFDGRNQQMAQTRWQWLRFVGTGQFGTFPVSDLDRLFWQP